MSDYQETVAEGRLWKRCRQLLIDNPHEGQKVVRFFEENIVTIDGAVIRSDAGSCQTTFASDALVPVLDIATQEPTGEMVPHARIYELLFSAYMHAARTRDTGAVAVELVPEV